MIWVKNKIKMDKRDEGGKVKLNLNVSVVKFQRELCEYQNGSKNKKIKKRKRFIDAEHLLHRSGVESESRRVEYDTLL